MSSRYPTLNTPHLVYTLTLLILCYHLFFTGLYDIVIPGCSWLYCKKVGYIYRAIYFHIFSLYFADSSCEVVLHFFYLALYSGCSIYEINFVCRTFSAVELLLAIIIELFCCLLLLHF